MKESGENMWQKGKKELGAIDFVFVLISILMLSGSFVVREMFDSNLYCDICRIIGFASLFLFFIHRYQAGKGLMILVIIVAVILIIFGIFVSKQISSNDLGLDLSSGIEIENYDTHGGFHGDGMTFIVYEFSDDNLLMQIKENDEWNRLPLEDIVGTLVYGTVENNKGIVRQRGPYITNGNGDSTPLIPEIKNGYYLFLDRHSQKNEEVLERASFNFTLGIYDTDNNILYYCEFDT